MIPLDESSMHSWSTFGRLATPGKARHSSPFVGNGSHRNSLDVNYFVSWLLLYIVLTKKTELGKNELIRLIRD